MLPAECTSISSLTRGKYLYKYAQVLAFWLNHKWSAVALTIQGGKKVPYLARNDFARDACRRHQGWNDMCAFRSNCWRSVWILIGKESWGDIGIISAGDHTPIAIGSGTCVSRGIAGRLAAYENGLDSRHVPRHVWRAFQQGFTKTHTALLCWSQAPPVGQVTIGRQRFLGIEGIFQMLLFAAYSNKADPIWAGSIEVSRAAFAEGDVGAQWLPLHGLTGPGYH